MNLQDKLSDRIHMDDIHEILLYVEGNNGRKQKLYDLIYNKEDLVGYKALWVFSHFDSNENEWLNPRQDELIDEVLRCSHPGKRRLLLNLLLRQSFPNPPRVDLLDFCLNRMLSKDELPGVQTLCMKLAYKLSSPIPELLEEMRCTLEIMEIAMLPISIRTVRRNILTDMKKRKGGINKKLLRSIP